ncbi:MAG: hypothetical protein ACREVL_06665, partial [Solimonas sp.]
DQHRDAFYQGLRLCSVDGSRAPVANTPPIKARMPKARSRRRKGGLCPPQLGGAAGAGPAQLFNDNYSSPLATIIIPHSA